MTLNELIEALEKDAGIRPQTKRNKKKTGYSSGLLNDVAYILEVRGIEQARLYLRSKPQHEANLLLKVLNYIENCPSASKDPPVAGTVIKSLNSVIKSWL